MAGVDAGSEIRNQYGNFTQIPNAILETDELSNEAKLLYVHLTALSYDTTVKVYRKTLAERMGKSVDSVDRYLKELVAFDALEIEKRWSGDVPISSLYTLLIIVPKRPAPEPELPEGSRTHAARGSRTDAARGSRTSAPRGSRTHAALKDNISSSLNNPPTPQGDGGEASPDEYSMLFTTFWDVYPRKEGVDSAHRAFRAALGRGVSAETIIIAATHYRDSLKQGDWIYPPTSWIRDGHYKPGPAPLTPPAPLKPRGKTIHDLPEL